MFRNQLESEHFAIYVKLKLRLNCKLGSPFSPLDYGAHVKSGLTIQCAAHNTAPQTKLIIKMHS